MKRLLTILAVFALLLASCAEKPEENTSKLVYTEINGGSEYEVTSAGFERGDTLNIPSEYNGKPVTVIGDRAFLGLHFKNVVIPDSVTHIGTEAFASCGDLESVETSAVLIGAAAFSNCKNLKSVTLKGSITRIDSGAFENCQSLESIVFPSTVTEIGNRAFFNCSALKNIGLPFCVRSIGEQAFMYCGSIETLVIPQYLESIGENAFSYCHGVSSIRVESGNKKYYVDGNCLIEQIEAENYLVMGCKTSIIPNNNSINGIYDSAFKGCAELEQISVPEGVTSIPKSAFAGCASLKTVVLPESIKRIESDAFSGCRNLESVNLPDGIEFLASSAFNECPAVETEDNVSYLGKWCLSNSSFDKVITVREGTEHIAAYAFSDLEYIELPASLKSIGEKALWDCFDLKKIEYKGTEQQWNNIKKPVDIMAPECECDISFLDVPEGHEYLYETMRALVDGAIDVFEDRCGVGVGVYEDLRGIEIGDFEIYFEGFPVVEDGSIVEEFPVLKLEVISGESKILPVGTHELVFFDGMYATFVKKDEFKWPGEGMNDISPAVSYVYDVGSDRDFESVKKEGLREFGLCDFIIIRLDAISGNYRPRTEEEIKAYAEKYLGVSGDELVFGDKVNKVEGGYTILGRGDSSPVSTVVSEVVKDGITVVTMQFWADYSKFVPLRKVEFYMELIDGEYKPIKTVILEDSEFATAFYGC